MRWIRQAIESFVSQMMQSQRQWVICDSLHVSLHPLFCVLQLGTWVVPYHERWWEKCCWQILCLHSWVRLLTPDRSLLTKPQDIFLTAGTSLPGLEGASNYIQDSDEQNLSEIGNGNALAAWIVVDMHLCLQVVSGSHFPLSFRFIRRVAGPSLPNFYPVSFTIDWVISQIDRNLCWEWISEISMAHCTQATLCLWVTNIYLANCSYLSEF